MTSCTVRKSDVSFNNFLKDLPLFTLCHIKNNFILLQKYIEENYMKYKGSDIANKKYKCKKVKLIFLCF